MQKAPFTEPSDDDIEQAQQLREWLLEHGYDLDDCPRCGGDPDGVCYHQMSLEKGGTALDYDPNKTNGNGDDEEEDTEDGDDSEEDSEDETE